MTQSEPPEQGAPGPDQEQLWESPGEPGRGAGSQRSRGGGPAPAWTQSLTSTTPVPGPAGFYFADVPNRVIAYVIDAIVLSVIGFILTIVVGGLFGGLVSEGGSLEGGVGELNMGAFLVISILQLLVSIGYFGYSWTTLRATPGMKLLGLQIGDETDGRPITLNQALIRWLILGIPSILATFASYVSSGLGLILSLVGLVWLLILLWTIAQSPTKQGLHDRYAHTILVKAGRRAT